MQLKKKSGLEMLKHLVVYGLLVLKCLSEPSDAFWALLFVEILIRLLDKK